MKNTIYVLLVICLISISAVAQRFEQHTWTPKSSSHEVVSFKTDATTADTIGLSHFDLGTATFTYYTVPAPAWGYLHGTNSFGFKAFAEKYDIKGPDSSVQIIAMAAIFAGKVSKVGNPNSITFGVHPTSSGGPGAAVSTLQIFDSTLSLVDTILRLTVRNMPAHSPLTDSFFVSYSTPSPNAPSNYDTLYNLVVNSRAAADTIVARNVVQTATGAPFSDIYQLSGLRHYLSILPVLSVTKLASVTEPMVSKNGLSAGAIFPNPVMDEASIHINSSTESIVNLMIFNMNGELISDLGSKSVSIGDNTLSFNTSLLSSGSYFLLVQQESNLMGIHFVK